MRGETGIPRENPWVVLILTETQCTYIVEMRGVIDDLYSKATWLPGINWWNCLYHHYPSYVYVCILSSSHSWSLFKFKLIIIIASKNTTVKGASASFWLIRSLLYNNPSSVQFGCMFTSLTALIFLSISSISFSISFSSSTVYWWPSCTFRAK